MICINRPRLSKTSAFTAAILLVAAGCQVSAAYAAGVATTTTLAASQAAQIVTLTATVAVSGTPVTAGTVNFCNAAATHCTDINLIGTAQLNSLGKATLKIPGIASNNYSAVFLGTIADASSISTSVSLPARLLPTTTSISKTGTVGNYSLTATVTGAVPSASTGSPSGTISFLNTGNGNTSVATAVLSGTPNSFAQTFAFPAAPQTGTGPNAIAVGDFNQDGFPDVAVVNSTDKTVSILLNNADGTGQFTAQPHPPSTGVGPAAIAFGDFKGNGILDLAVVNTTDGTVTVLLGNGDGTFQAGSAYATGTGPVAIAVGDLNGDGFLDLAVVNSTGKTVSVLINSGTGTFTTPGLTYATGTGPASIAAGDFNHDGFLDLAVVNATDKTVSVLINKQDGTFTVPAPTYQTGVGTASVVVGDYNSDGVLDLAVVNATDGTVSVLLGHAAMPGIGDGTFSAETSYGAGSDPVALTVGDFSGDGVADLAVVNQTGKTVSVLIGKGDGTFPTTAPPTYPTGNGPKSIVAGDFSADGVTDLAVVNSTSKTVSVLLDQLTQTTAATAAGILVPGSGTQTVGASYPADGTFAASTSTSPTTIAVMGSTTSVVVNTSLTPSALNQSVTFTATVAPTNGVEMLTGSVTFSLNGGNLTCTNAMNPVAINVNTGVATCTTTTLPAGDPLVIVATFNGTGYTSSNSSVNQKVNPAGTSTTSLTLASNTMPSTVNDSVTFKATLAPAPSAQQVPFNGTIAFTLGDHITPVNCTSGTFVPSTGVATCVTSSLAAGTDVIFADYKNDTSYPTKNTSINQIVHAAIPTVAVISSTTNNTSNVNDLVTFTATVSPSNKPVLLTAGATLMFKLGSATGPAVTCNIGSQTFDPASGIATCVTNTLVAGTDVIYALYAGDPNYQASNGNVSQTVNPAATSVAVTSSSPNNTSNVNDSVTFTATVSTSNKTVAFATGAALMFHAGSPTGPLVNCSSGSLGFNASTGTATCVISTLLAGSNGIYASYAGDANYQANNGNVSQTVNPAATSVAVTSSSSANTSNVNNPVTFTAMVSTTGKTVAFATNGTVTFTLNSVSGASVPCTTASTRFNASTGLATCVTAALTAGTDVIVATYNPGGTSDPNYQASNNSVSQIVNTAATSVMLTSSSTGNASNVNDSVTFTATLSTTSKTVAFSTAGTFSFRTVSATGPAVMCNPGSQAFDPATGIATCVTTTLQAGTDVVYATYTGDANYSSGSANVSQTVKSAASTIVKIVPIFSSDANALAVDQPVTFTATVGPAGQPVPQTGNVTFLIDGQMANCTNAPDPAKPNIVPTKSVLTASCSLDVSNYALIAGSHMVTAEYNVDNSDPNYVASSPVTVPQAVNSAGTTISVISSQANAVSTQAITFTATVIPQYPGSIPPKGTVAFSSPDGTADNLCKAQAVMTAAGLSQAICTVAFPPTTGGMFKVTATYTSLDQNFMGNSGSASETVQNVGLGISVGRSSIPQPVTVTQGYSNASDPFNTVAISVTAGPVAGFTDPLSLTCSAPAGSGLSCSVPGILNGDGSSSLPLTLTASPTAIVGSYTITVSAIDNVHPALSQTVALTSVYVAAEAATLSLVPGAVGTTQVAFPLPAGVTLSSLSCPTAYGNTPSSNPTLQNTSSLLISCKGVPASVAGSYLVTISTTVPTTQSSALSPLWPGKLVAAACLGLPFFFVAGRRRNKALVGREILRSLGVLLLVVALAQLTGCGGGSFQPPALPTTGSGTPPGNYLINVVATGTDSIKYQATVPLVVSQ